MNRIHTSVQSGQTGFQRREPVNALSAGAVLGFLPAFMDLENSEVHLSVNADGSPASIHLLDAIPEHWVTERDVQGRITALKDGIVAGFIRNGRFYSRSELACMPLDA
ncbi:MAG: hypothetical protein PHQ14_05375 [Chromatiales bacterium]|jgi:hypothetical protein|nr:hypothetical protein [Chromatiales bacterium]MDX9766851.1 hypothetical protein [Ectothiorhodospiraceae bacterium]